MSSDPQYPLLQMAERFKDELLDHSVLAEKRIASAYISAWERLRWEIESLAKEFHDKKAAGQEVTRSEIFKLVRYRDLEEQIYREMRGLQGELGKTIKASTHAGIRKATKDAFELFDITAGLSYPSKTEHSALLSSWNRLPKEAIAALEATIAGSESPVTKIIDSFGTITAYKMRDALVYGLVNGQSPRTVAKTMRKEMGVSLTRAMRIARTENIRAYRSATLMNYRENDDVIKGWQWKAALNTRTCIACWMMHGTVHPLTEFLNDHVQGRCAMLPILRSREELGLKPLSGEIAKKEASAIDPDAMKSGIEHFNKLPEKDQRAILAPAYYDAFKSGKIALDSLVYLRQDNVWGPSIAVRSLDAAVTYSAELQKTAGYNPDLKYQLPMIKPIVKWSTLVPEAEPIPVKVVKEEPQKSPWASAEKWLNPAEKPLFDAMSDQQKLLFNAKVEALDYFKKGALAGDPDLAESHAKKISKIEDDLIEMLAQAKAKLETKPKPVEVQPVSEMLEAAQKELVQTQKLVSDITALGNAEESIAAAKLLKTVKAKVGALKSAKEGKFGVDFTLAIVKIHDKNIKQATEALNPSNVPKVESKPVSVPKVKIKLPFEEIEPIRKLGNIEFPASVDTLREIRFLGGSTGAYLVEDPATGKRYVMKRGSNATHLREEASADGVYRKLGIPVPDFRLYETSEGPVKLAEFIEGESLRDIIKSGSQARIDSAFKSLQKGFAVDAFLANWDVIGLEYDNIIVDKDGVAWRIDNGGALRYRAQGSAKGGQYDNYVTELWSLRDSTINAQTARVFGQMDIYEIQRQLASLLAYARDLGDVVVPENLARLEKRLANIKDYNNAIRDMGKDGWDVNYVDGFAGHLAKIRQAGLHQALPTGLRVPVHGDAYSLRDEDGNPFDKMRTKESQDVMQRLEEYMKSNGGSFAEIKEYHSGQSGSSWSTAAVNVKYLLMQARGKTFDDFYWKGTTENEIKQNLDLLYTGPKLERLRKSIQMWHAFNYQFLLTTQLPNSDRDGRVLRLMRTENKAVMKEYGFTKVSKPRAFKRGPLESTSLVYPVSIDGDQLTLQIVPFHRIFTNYIYGGFSTDGKTCLYSDSENEFLAMLDGIKIVNVGDYNIFDRTNFDILMKQLKKYWEKLDED